MSDGSDHRAEEIKLLARDHAELAIQTLAEVAGDSTLKEAARVLAAKTLLERGFGAPERRVEQKVDVRVTDVRQAHFEALKTLASRSKVGQINTNAPLIEDASYSEIPPRKE